uniref:Uncharacterized protein n=1 Tax=Oryza nivara TaxID=4536 RepID=A0A0E0J106_ORYNI
MPTPAQLGWVFTRKGRESTRQHLQGENGARRCRCRRSCDQTRLSPKTPSKCVEPLRSQSRNRPNHQHRQTQHLSHRKAPQPGLEADSQKKGGAPRMKEA